MAEEKVWYCVVHIDDTIDWRKCYGPYENYESAEKMAKIMVQNHNKPDEWLECLSEISIDGFWINNVSGGGIFIMEMDDE